MCKNEKDCDNKQGNDKKGDEDMLAVKTINTNNKTDLSKVMESMQKTKRNIQN